MFFGKEDWTFFEELKKYLNELAYGLVVSKIVKFETLAGYLTKFFPDKMSLKHFYRRRKSMTGRAGAGRKLNRLHCVTI